jgi:hypothetical protein
VVVTLINRAFSYKKHANRLMMMFYNGSSAGLVANMNLLFASSSSILNQYGRE